MFLFGLIFLLHFGRRKNTAQAESNAPISNETNQTKRYVKVYVYTLNKVSNETFCLKQKGDLLCFDGLCGKSLFINETSYKNLTMYAPLNISGDLSQNAITDALWDSFDIEPFVETEEVEEEEEEKVVGETSNNEVVENVEEEEEAVQVVPQIRRRHRKGIFRRFTMHHIKRGMKNIRTHIKRH